MTTDKPFPERLKHGHTEVNEDGEEIHHSGYHVAKCLECGREVLAAKSRRGWMSVGNCGRAVCQKEDVAPQG